MYVKLVMSIIKENLYIYGKQNEIRMKNIKFNFGQYFRAWVICGIYFSTDL
jgi:hypothetical protein